jgi:hypothetical protein
VHLCLVGYSFAQLEYSHHAPLFKDSYRQQPGILA